MCTKDYHSNVLNLFMTMLIFNITGILLHSLTFSYTFLSVVLVSADVVSV